MYDAKVKKKNGMTMVSIKKSLFKRIDDSMLKLLQSRTLVDACNVDIEKRACVYTMPESESIYNILKRDNGEVCELLLTSIIQLSRVIRRYNLPLNNLILNTKLIFYNKAENKIYFIYQPYIESAVLGIFSNIHNDILKIINKFIQKDNRKSKNTNIHNNYNQSDKSHNFNTRNADKSYYADNNFEKTVFLGNIVSEKDKTDDITTFIRNR